MYTVLMHYSDQCTAFKKLYSYNCNLCNLLHGCNNNLLCVPAASSLLAIVIVPNSDEGPLPCQSESASPPKISQPRWCNGHEVDGITVVIALSIERLYALFSL